MGSVYFPVSQGYSKLEPVDTEQNYVFTPSGLSSLQFPQLPSMDGKKVKFTFEDFSWPSAKGYMIYQGGSSSANRELAIGSVNGDMSITIGGRTATFLYMSIAFGLPTRTRPSNVKWELTIEANGTIVSVVDGVEVARSGEINTGTSYFVTPTISRTSYARLEGAPFRLGARSDNDTPTTEETGYPVTADDRIGNLLIEIDDIPVRNTIMPKTSNLPVLDTLDSANNGKILLGTGDDFALPNQPNYVADYSMFVPNGASNCYFPTLGTINGNKIAITLRNVTWLSGSGYLFGQAGSVEAEREFGMFGAGGSINIVAGGTSLNIGAYTQVFGLATDQKLLNAEIKYTLEINGDYEIQVDGVVTDTGNITRGTSRLEGCLFRIGARNNSTNIADGEGFYFLQSGDKVGGFDVELNDTPVRSVDFPTFSRRTILDSLNTSNNGLIHGGSLDSKNTIDFSWMLPAPSVDSVAPFGYEIEKVVVIGASINDQSAQIPTTGFVQNYIFNKYGIEVEFFDRSTGGWTTPRIDAESGATFKEFERQEGVVVLLHTAGNDGNEGETYDETNSTIKNLSITGLNNLYDKAHSYGFHLVQAALTFRNYGFDTLDESGNISDIVKELGGSYTWTRDFVAPIMANKAPYLLGEMQGIPWPKVDMYNAVRNVHATFRRSETDTRHPDVWGQFYMLAIQTEGAVRLSRGLEPIAVPRRDYTNPVVASELDLVIDLTTDDYVLTQPREINPMGTTQTFKDVVYDSQDNLLSNVKIHTNTTDALAIGLGNAGNSDTSLENNDLLTGVHRYVNGSSYREDQPFYFYIEGLEPLKEYELSGIISANTTDTELKLQLHDDTPKFDLDLYDFTSTTPNILSTRVVSDFQGGFLVASHEVAENGGGGESYLSGVRVRSLGVNIDLPTITLSPDTEVYNLIEGDSIPPITATADDGSAVTFTDSGTNPIVRTYSATNVNGTTTRTVTFNFAYASLPVITLSPADTTYTLEVGTSLPTIVATADDGSAVTFTESGTNPIVRVYTATNVNGTTTLPVTFSFVDTSLPIITLNPTTEVYNLNEGDPIPVILANSADGSPVTFVDTVVSQFQTIREYTSTDGINTETKTVVFNFASNDLSSLRLNIIGIPNGVYDVDFYYVSSKQYAFSRSVTFASGFGTSEVSVSSGTELEYRVSTSTHYAGNFGESY